METIDPQQGDIGIGATEQLSLRVSVATLSKVIFKHPDTNETMLVLERTATWQEITDEPCVIVKAKPFGGGVRLNKPASLQALIGEFHYDSQRSRQEMDFRIQICPEDWESAKGFCLHHFQENDGVIESSPERELVEEFNDALKIKVTRDVFQLRPMGICIEEIPSKTENVRTPGTPTVRIYKLYKVRIRSPRLIAAILENNQDISNTDLQDLAWLDQHSGGKGRANGVLALPLDAVIEAYQALPPKEHSTSISIKGHQIDSNVLAILEEVDTPRYKRIDIE
jgi:hypothetical protein